MRLCGEDDTGAIADEGRQTTDGFLQYLAPNEWDAGTMIWCGSPGKVA